MVEIYSTLCEFAAVLKEGVGIMTWCDKDISGDLISVKTPPVGVHIIYLKYYAFAAVLGDGSVMTRDDEDCGVDSSSVQMVLLDDDKIHSTRNVFATVLKTRSVMTWDREDSANDASNV